MNKHLLGGLAALALVAGVAPASAEDIYFTVINHSPQDIYFFYASPSNTSDWGNDLLEEMVSLEVGYQATANIVDGSDQCLYDFKFILADGSDVIEPRVDICQLNSLTIN